VDDTTFQYAMILWRRSRLRREP